MIYVGYSKRASYVPGYCTDSLKEQNDRIRVFAKCRSSKINKFYEDKSNDPQSNSGFQHLKEDGLKRKFDVVIIDSIFRCGRNIFFARDLLLDVFYRAGIQFIILEDNIDSSMMSYEELKDYFFRCKQRASAQIKKYRNEQMLMETGKISKMRISYGYKLSSDETEIEVDEYAAGVIRRIFDMYDSGKSYKDIMNILNDEGIKPPGYYLKCEYGIQSTSKTNVWNKSTLGNVRHKERLCGSTEDLGYKEIYYPEIISKEQFVRVNEMHMGHTRGRSLPKRVENAFNRKIYYCNTDNILMCRKNKGEDSYRYFHRKGKKVKLIRYDDVEVAVRSRLIQEKTVCEQIAGYLNDGRDKELTNDIEVEYKKKAAVLYKESLAAIEDNIPLFQKYENGDISKEEYDCQHNSIVSDFILVSDRFHLIQEEMAERIKDVSANNLWLKRYIGFNADEEITKKLVNQLVDKIIIDDDKNIHIYLYDSEAKAFPNEWRRLNGTEE